MSVGGQISIKYLFRESIGEIDLRMGQLELWVGGGEKGGTGCSLLLAETDAGGEKTKNKQQKKAYRFKISSAPVTVTHPVHVGSSVVPYVAA